MTTTRKIVIVLLALLWIGLSWLVLSRGGITLYNILVVTLAGAFILLPLCKSRK